MKENHGIKHQHILFCEEDSVDVILVCLRSVSFQLMP